MACVIKILLGKNKAQTAASKKSLPEIMSQAQTKFKEISSEIVPYGSERYPEGSYYKSSDNDIYFILDKPSVALRCSIEFMQTWYNYSSLNFPECKIIIDQGSISHSDSTKKLELSGIPFNNISKAEKDLSGGQIFVTHSILNDVDRTMVSFAFTKKYKIKKGKDFKTFQVKFLDTRTIDDSSLIHGLFIANPKGAEARERVIELFLIEYALEHGKIQSLKDVRKWGISKGYPIPPSKHLEKLITNSSKFQKDIIDYSTCYTIKDEEKKIIEDSKAEFHTYRKQCIEHVTKKIKESTLAVQSTKAVDIGLLIEEYLSSLFSEIRMMANYFNYNHEIFQPGQDTFPKYNFILRRYLPNLNNQYFEEWKTGFFTGLREEALRNNPFLSAIFHNVLATYYLNRSPKTRSYQIEKIKNREIYLDTNVLYALIVAASNHNEIVSYIIEHLNKLGINPKVFPFTIDEYEQSLESVENQFSGSKPSLNLVSKNPWLLQEFRANEIKYQESIALCRRLHSVTKGLPITEKNYKEIDEKLTRYGLRIEPKFTTYSDEEVHELWVDFRNLMPSDYWDMSKYWDFIYFDSTKPESVKHHDVHCIQNLIEKTCTQCEDEFGISSIFLTLDTRRVLRLQKKYGFIMSPQQCLEFFMPYLFLADIPLEEPEKFPNFLLSAGLGTMIVSSPPEVIEMIRKFLEDPSLLEKTPSYLSETGKEIATALNSDRIKTILNDIGKLDDVHQPDIVSKLNEIINIELKTNRASYYEKHSELKGILDEKDKEIEKLHRTVKYWRSQARKQ